MPLDQLTKWEHGLAKRHNWPCGAGCCQLGWPWGNDHFIIAPCPLLWSIIHPLSSSFSLPLSRPLGTPLWSCPNPRTSPPSHHWTLQLILLPPPLFLLHWPCLSPPCTCPHQLPSPHTYSLFWVFLKNINKVTYCGLVTWTLEIQILDVPTLVNYGILGNFLNFSGHQFSHL